MKKIFLVYSCSLLIISSKQLIAPPKNIEFYKKVTAHAQRITQNNMAQAVRTQQAQNDLIKACAEGNLKKFKDAITSGGTLDKKNSTGELGLVMATYKQQLEIIQYIVQNYPQVINLRDRNGNCALTTAIAWRHNNIAEYLINNGANIEQVGFGGTALSIACTIGNNEGISLLLKHKANPNYTSPYFETPLHIAAESRRSIVPLLCNNGANTESQNHQGETPLLLSIKKDAPIEIISALITPQNINIASLDQTTPLMSAARNLNVLATAILISRGADVTSTNEDIKINGIGQYQPSTSDNNRRINIIKSMLERATQIKTSTTDNN